MALCFDLDGTLGHFGGGYVLMREVLGRLWGQEPTREQLLACHGSTDWEIVGELHVMVNGSALTPEAYDTYAEACLTAFRQAFAPEATRPRPFAGILAGLHRLAERHTVWIVSGNAPGLLDFKAEALGIHPGIPRLGSLPHHSRASLIREALRQCGEGAPCACGRALYVGDRPWDRDAAADVGVPFLGIGEAWSPNDPHPSLGVDAPAEHLVAAVEALLGT